MTTYVLYIKDGYTNPENVLQFIFTSLEDVQGFIEQVDRCGAEAFVYEFRREE